MTSFAEAMTDRREGSEGFGNGWTRADQGKWVVFAESTHDGVAYLGEDGRHTAFTSISIQSGSKDAKISKDAKDSIGADGLQSSKRSRISRCS